MSIKFTKLKSPILGLTDRLPMGKYKTCRICDIIEDDYEYLLWLKGQNLVQYTKEVLKSLNERAIFILKQEHYENEIKPYLDDDLPY